jgi:zinc protease
VVPGASGALRRQRLGYALDSKWYGTGECTKFMRGRLANLTRDEVNAAIRKHFSSKNLSVVIMNRE